VSGINTIIRYVFFICVGVTFAFTLLSYPLLSVSLLPALTLILLTWRISWATNNASRWQIKFHSAFKELMLWFAFFHFLLIFLYLHAAPYRPLHYYSFSYTSFLIVPFLYASTFVLDFILISHLFFLYIYFLSLFRFYFPLLVFSPFLSSPVSSSSSSSSSSFSLSNSVLCLHIARYSIVWL